MRLFIKSFLGVLLGLSLCSPAWAAFPTVQARSIATVNGTALVVTLPAGSTDGDLIVILLQAGNSNYPPTFTTWSQTGPGTTGWTELYDSQGEAFYYKQIGAAEANPSFTSSVSDRSGASALRITGHEDPATQAPEASAGATGTSAIPDPDSLTPTGGAKDYLWIAVDGNTDGRRTVSAAPTNYLNLNAFSTAGGASGATGATAERQLNAASEDPGIFTISGSSLWEAHTIAIHPSTAPAARRIMLID